MLVIYSMVIVACGLAALVDFYLWGYDYGHNLDPTAPIVVPGMSYQPPLIGSKQLLNFTAFSGPDIGGWIFVASGILILATLTFELYQARHAAKNQLITSFAAIAIAGFMISCSVAPEPLQYGKDNCYHCKMTLMDNKFGGEVVSTKGKTFKFDDTNCMMNFVNSGELQENDVAHYLITDFASPGILIDAKNALYVRSEAIKSPMAGNIAAFHKENILKSYNSTWKGQQLTWNDLTGSK